MLPGSLGGSHVAQSQTFDDHRTGPTGRRPGTGRTHAQIGTVAAGTGNQQAYREVQEMQRRTGSLVGGGAIAVAFSMTGAHLEEALLGLLATGAMLLILGVVLPAVWSSRPDRRRDARAVLRLMLHALPQSRRR
jgi:hypothetical protein